MTEFEDRAHALQKAIEIHGMGGWPAEHYIRTAKLFYDWFENGTVPPQLQATTSAIPPTPQQGVATPNRSFQTVQKKADWSNP